MNEIKAPEGIKPIESGKRIPDCELERIDASWGRLVKCSCTDNAVAEGYTAANPLHIGAQLELTYENGSIFDVQALFMLPLFHGFVHTYDDNGNECCLVNRQLIALAATAQAALEPIPVGDVKIPSPEEADAVCAALAVPPLPEIPGSRDGVLDAWMDQWRKSGKLCEMMDGQWAIESALPPEALKYRVRHYVGGELVNFLGTTPYIELTTGEIKRAVDMTDADFNLIAGVEDSDINSGKVDGKEAYEAQQRAGKPSIHPALDRMLKACAEEQELMAAEAASVDDSQEE